MFKLSIQVSVGYKGVNNKRDVEIIQARLNEIGKNCGSVDGKCGPKTIQAIESVQKHFMRKPDKIIDPKGRTMFFLNRWSIKPVNSGVDLRGNLKKAWDLLNPLLPPSSKCTSGYRSPEKQRQILHHFFSKTYKRRIIAKYGLQAYNEVWADKRDREADILKMVRGIGQAIAAPGKSMHQKGRAFDIGGPSSIDPEQVRIAKIVAAANPDIFTGKVLQERNGCVHVEIKP